MQLIILKSRINTSINASIQKVYLCCELPQANDYMSHLQDVTTVKLAIKQFY